jgi:hypothetical protein
LPCSPRSPSLATRAQGGGTPIRPMTGEISLRGWSCQWAASTEKVLAGRRAAGHHDRNAACPQPARTWTISLPTSREQARVRVARHRRTTRFRQAIGLSVTEPEPRKSAPRKPSVSRIGQRPGCTPGRCRILPRIFIAYGLRSRAANVVSVSDRPAPGRHTANP